MSAPAIGQLPSRQLIRALLMSWHDVPRPRAQVRALDEMRAELRRREVLPVASEVYQLGPPIEDPFCEEEDGP